MEISRLRRAHHLQVPAAEEVAFHCGSCLCCCWWCARVSGLCVTAAIGDGDRARVWPADACRSGARSVAADTVLTEVEMQQPLAGVAARRELPFVGCGHGQTGKILTRPGLLQHRIG